MFHCTDIYCLKWGTLPPLVKGRGCCIHSFCERKYKQFLLSSGSSSVFGLLDLGLKLPVLTLIKILSLIHCLERKKEVERGRKERDGKEGAGAGILGALVLICKTCLVRLPHELLRAFNA